MHSSLENRCVDLQADLARLDAEMHLSALPGLAKELRIRLRQNWLGKLDGLAAAQLISAVNDRLTAKIIALTARLHALPPIAWCWLAFGSEGRCEQTLVTDQDNGLIFAAVDAQEARAVRPLFLAFAQEVNKRLAEAGFTLCKGDIMAGNPACCLAEFEWNERFIEWIRRPDPQALLNATIFFDLRPLYGDFDLATRMQQPILALARDTPAFLYLMASNALQASPPLGFRGELHADKEGRINLKKFGSRIFVDVARIWALAASHDCVDTFSRLRCGQAVSGLPEMETQALHRAFSEILRLRLQIQQCDDNEGEQGCMLKQLHDMDRAILKAAMRLAQQLQQRLKLDYSL